MDPQQQIVYQKKPHPNEVKQEEHKGPHISNVEWGLVISGLGMIDLIQVVLDLLFQVGVALNRFIDVFVGMTLALYLQIRGQSLADGKRLMGFIGTFVAEEIPDVDALPFWFLDGLYNMSLAKASEQLHNTKIGQKVNKVTAITSAVKNPEGNIKSQSSKQTMKDVDDLRKKQGIGNNLMPFGISPENQKKFMAESNQKHKETMARIEQEGKMKHDQHTAFMAESEQNRQKKQERYEWQKRMETESNEAIRKRTEYLEKSKHIVERHKERGWKDVKHMDEDMNEAGKIHDEVYGEKNT